MGKPKVMVVGSGGREHAIVDLFFRSGADVFFNGRNAGASQIAELLPDLDLLTAAEKIQPDLVIFGSEDNLFSGARDELLDKGFNCVGPSKYGARLEGSKMFGRVVSLQAGIPKPAEPTSIQDYPYYLKYERLAAGKGAHLVENKEHHDVALEFCSSNDRTGEFVLEKVVKGKEFSSFLYCHEGCVFLLGHAADHKRLNQDPQSLMTGGMASISPHPKLDSDMLDGIAIDWGSATLRALADRDIQYEGFLYLGGIASGEAIYLLEYNCRLGDPEAGA
ncbi:MAG: hypothetical protein JKX97_00650, partial [Candidatus Lindowbacteria bacterium]|nr:hypothetical protein [Candidatus Lindowbacteria bacterium]